MMKKLLVLLSLVFLLSCEEDLSNVSNVAVFNELWTYIDENYIYFDQKGVDWDQVREDYAPLIGPDLSESEFFELCTEMLNLLRDGHNDLLTRTNIRGSYDFRAGYEIHFDLSTVERNYVINDLQQRGFYAYGLLGDGIGYIYLERFSGVFLISSVMEYFQDKNLRGLVLDIRDNTGGAGQDAVEIVGYFVPSPTVVGYLVEKTGQAHDDVSEPLSVSAFPKEPYFDIPLVLLTNRSSFSASTYLASQLKDLPNVTLVGQVTGGGGGGNQTQELSNGWVVSISSSKLLDKDFNEDIEDGVAPDIAIANDSTMLASGIDEMLERALEVF